MVINRKFLKIFKKFKNLTLVSMGCFILNLKIFTIILEN